QGVGLLVREAARLDLDEHGDVAAPDDQIDLAHRRLNPAVEHAVALRLQGQGGERLAATAGALGELSFLARALVRKPATTFRAPAHETHSWALRARAAS